MFDKKLRKLIVKMLDGQDAHLDFESVVSDFPPELRTARPEGAAHNAWQLLEHLRLAQWDILEFSRDPNHVSPPFPEGYWPKPDDSPDEQAWDNSVRALEDDLKAMQDLVGDNSVDLHASIPHGTGQTVLREAILVIKHNSYHLGQLALLRRLLGIV
jgi:uncharacterized damage-inducible protein DinB